GGPGGGVGCGRVRGAAGGDGGGWVRRRAGLGGGLALKPTYGGVSRWGLVAFGSSLARVGLFARHVGDLAEGYAVIAGSDPFDASMRDGPVPDVSGWAGGVAGVRFGWPANLWRQGGHQPIARPPAP